MELIAILRFTSVIATVKNVQLAFTEKNENKNNTEKENSEEMIKLSRVEAETRQKKLKFINGNSFFHIF